MGMEIFGDQMCGGSYVLRMRVDRPTRVSFGQFMAGRPIGVIPGTYVYVGSAMGRWQSLGRRLARHATRSVASRPYAIREEIARLFGQGVLPQGEKRLRWHIDYMLDCGVVDLTDILGVCSPVRLEGAIADLLLNDASARVFAPGLGASDHPGKTHILQVPNGNTWWHGFSLRAASCTSL